MCLCLFVVAGCYHVEKKPKPKGLVRAQSKVYAAVTPEEVFQASEQIFILADESDMEIVKETRRLKASRPVTDSVSVPYWEGWEIQAIPVDGSTQVTVSVALTRGRDRKIYPRDPGVYHLFFTRLEYLLGKSETWMTCDDYEAQTHRKPFWEEDTFLCLNADDVPPSELPGLVGGI